MTDIRTGFVTQVGMTYDETIAYAGETGFDFVELMMDGDHARTRIDGQVDRFREQADAAGVDLLVHLPFKLDIGSPAPHVRQGALDELVACLETAAAIGAEKAVLHAASQAWDAVWTRDHIQEQILAAVRTLDDAAADAGVELCVENVPNEYFDVYDFPRLFDETGAAMTLDTGHARISGMDSADMQAFLADHRDRVSHLHLNDTRRPEDEHLPFGAGNLDFEQMLSPLQDGWNGTLSLEVLTDNMDYITESKQRLDRLL